MPDVVSLLVLGRSLARHSYASLRPYSYACCGQVRRLMEEENRKARKAKRRDFNETVRELVAFVRKRDKRIAAHQVFFPPLFSAMQKLVSGINMT